MSNLLKRTLTSIVFVAVMVAALMHPIIFGAVFLIIMTVAMQEFYRMALGSRFQAAQRLAILCAAVSFLVVYANAQYGISLAWLAVGLLLLIAIGITMVMTIKVEEASAYALVYVPLLTIALPILITPRIVFNAGEFDGRLLLSIFVIIWLSDVGAYFVGSALGKREGARRMAAHISPKKSWAGFWGGLASAVLISLALHFTGLFHAGIWNSLAVGLTVGLASVLGDLQESMWKRCFGVKDSGNCIPGHGGMYDRFDSSLTAIPCAFVYMILMNLI